MANLRKPTRPTKLWRSNKKSWKPIWPSWAAEYRKAAGPGTVDVDKLANTQRFEILLRAQHKHLLEQRELVASEIERRRQRLVEANREVHVLEKLEERQIERHREEEARREAKLMDETAGIMNLREKVTQ